MNLVDTYIHEVTRRLPEKSRNEIELELESIIYDMLPDEYNEKEVESVLEKLGDPAVLASRYSDRPMHLIGPKYYDIYLTLLKIILPVSIIISLVSVAAVQFLNGEDMGMAELTLTAIFRETISNVISVSVQTFFWLTLLFAVMERMDKKNDGTPLSINFRPWTPEDLKTVTYIPREKAVRKMEVYGAIIWTAIWATIYFYADHLLGIYEKGENGWKLVTPAVNQDLLLSFWPFVILFIGSEIFLVVYKLIKREWDSKMAWFTTIYEIISSIVFIIIFTRPNFFKEDFLQLNSEMLNTSLSVVENSFIWGLCIIFILNALYTVSDSFKRAKIIHSGNK
ncbi:hypothetical protein SAMN04487944_11082 [Gracilibacillus ureilyticus]|uniref:Uncharacterized protein n=1 Tax=Gracilibacillus ureilyticus TaxID=531814 RepID=A0A1H9S6E8_9BACI|nr:hypothetical protein [Gracilibacillus ureilyticus]SER79729.1 hypothetical protein SAMN04487944_11082 [Gracilibacillus ureilyticus]